MMNVEVTYSATIKNQNLIVKVTEQMETRNKTKIQEMKEVLADFCAPVQQDQIEVRCSPVALPSVPTPPGNSTNQKSDSPKKITSSQVGFLLRLLRGHKIDVQRFCQENRINRIEDLSMDNARTIIADLNKS